MLHQTTGKRSVSEQDWGFQEILFKQRACGNEEITGTPVLRLVNTMYQF